jgi:hypothetical protein
MRLLSSIRFAPTAKGSSAGSAEVSVAKPMAAPKSVKIRPTGKGR